MEPRRVRNLVVVLLLAALLPIGLSRMAGPEPLTIAMPLVALAVLLVCGLVAHRKGRLSHDLSRALRYWGFAATLLAAGKAGLELTALLEEPIYKSSAEQLCRPELLYLTCPFVLIIEPFTALAYIFSYVAYQVGVLFRTVGVPLAFGLSALTLWLGARAMKRHAQSAGHGD